MVNNNFIPIVEPGKGVCSYASEADMWECLFRQLFFAGRHPVLPRIYIDAVTVLIRFTPFGEGVYYNVVFQRYVEWGEKHGVCLVARVIEAKKEKEWLKEFKYIAAALCYATEKEFHEYAVEDGFQQFINNNKLFNHES